MRSKFALWINEKRSLWTVLAVLLAVCFYLVKYLTNGSTPGVNQGSPLGWWNWFDQGQYLESARALSKFDFNPSQHLYPIGYPLLGALFYRWLPLHPFLIPDLLLFLLILSIVFTIYKKFFSSLESACLVGCMLLINPEVIENLVIPWTIIPSTFMICLSVYILVFRALDKWTFPLAGILAGASFFFRPGDFLFYLPMVFFAILSSAEWKVRLKSCLIFFAAFASIISFAAVVNKVIYHHFFKTPYNTLSAAIGFSIYNIPFKLYTIVVNAGAIYNISDKMMVGRFPWLLLLLPGTVFAIRRYGMRVIGLVISIVVTYLFYLAYNDFDAQVIFTMKAIRYFTWTFPFLWLFAYLSIRKSWTILSKKAIVILAILPVLIISFISITISRVEAKIDRTGPLDNLTIIQNQNKKAIRLIYLKNMPKEGYAERNIYPQIVLDGKQLRHFKDYRGIYRSDGVVLLLHRPAYPSVVGVGWEGIDAQARARVSSIELYDIGFGIKNRFDKRYPRQYVQVPLPILAAAEKDFYHLPKEKELAITFSPFNESNPINKETVGIATGAVMKSEKTILLDGNNNRIELKVHNKEYGLYLWVCPSKHQVQYADLLSSHREGFKGFTIEQDGSKLPLFNFGIGNGKQWKGVSNIAIKPREWNLIVLNIGKKDTHLFVQNRKFYEYGVEEPPFMPDDVPLFIGNWYLGGRPFHGLVSSIVFSHNLFDQQEVRALYSEKPQMSCNGMD